MGRNLGSEEIKGFVQGVAIQGHSRLQNELAGDENLEKTDPLTFLRRALPVVSLRMPGRLADRPEARGQRHQGDTGMLPIAGNLMTYFTYEDEDGAGHAGQFSCIIMSKENSLLDACKFLTKELYS
jgi:hypothetical protein